MYKQVFVTGGCGFLGSNFVNEMVRKYPESHFHNMDRIDYCASLDNVRVSEYPNYHFYKGDINDANFVMHILNTYHIELIVHLAAQTHVDMSFDKSLQYTLDNVMGTHCLLDCAKRYGKLKLFVHMSTDEVYGEVSKEHPGCCEKSILNPTNPYAATKAAAEMLVNSYYYSYHLPIIIIRANNMFGPCQYPEKLIPKFILALLKNQKMTIHGNGETRRNFIHVDDVVGALDVIIHNGEVGEIYNIGTDSEFNVLEVSRLLHSLLCPTSSNWEDYIEYVEDRPFNDFRYSINPSKLLKLGWFLKHNDFTKDVTELIEWYRQPRFLSS